MFISTASISTTVIAGESPCKWLDLKALSEQLSSPNRIQSVRYYTARISGGLIHPPSRQQIYLDALKTVPEITIHLGSFLVTKPWQVSCILLRCGRNSPDFQSTISGCRKGLED